MPLVVMEVYYDHTVYMVTSGRLFVRLKYSQIYSFILIMIKLCINNIQYPSQNNEGFRDTWMVPRE